MEHANMIWPFRKPKPMDRTKEIQEAEDEVDEARALMKERRQMLEQLLEDTLKKHG